jgi:hypothetical protein
MIKFTKIKFTYSLLITLFAITVFLSGFVVVLNGGIRRVLRKYGVADRERVPVVLPRPAD